MEWISVKDQLPEKDVQVLAYMLLDNIQGISTAIYYKNEDHWEIENCLYDNCYDIPTYWMRLPEPPKPE